MLQGCTNSLYLITGNILNYLVYNLSCFVFEDLSGRLAFCLPVVMFASIGLRQTSKTYSFCRRYFCKLFFKDINFSMSYVQLNIVSCLYRGAGK